MSGETDLPKLLAAMSPRLRNGLFVFVTVEENDPLEREAHAVVREAEGRSLVLPLALAETAGLPFEARFSWITLDVHSSLEAVGLTAAVAGRLAEAGISANVIAGHFHDHVLVPESRAEEALEKLGATAGR